MTTAGGFLVPLIPGGWAYHNWVFPVFAEPSPRCHYLVETGILCPGYQRWAGSFQVGLRHFLGSFCEGFGGFWKARGECGGEQAKSYAPAVGNTTGVLDIWILEIPPPPADWHPVLLSQSKAEYDPFEFCDFIMWKSAKAFDTGISLSCSAMDC